MTPRLFLVDVNGTLHVGPRPVGNAVAALAKLKRHCEASGSVVLFCSNTSRESTREIVEGLRRMGFRDVGEDDVVTPLKAIDVLLQSRNVRNPMLLLNEGAKREAFSRIPDLSRPHDAVVVGLAESALNYPNLNAAFQALSAMERPLLVASHRGRYFASGEGARGKEGAVTTRSLGPGLFVELLESAVPGVKAISCGKPSRSFFESCVAKAEARLREKRGAFPSGGFRGRTVMVGDDAKDDVLAAVELGMEGVLLRSGKYRPGDEVVLGTRPFTLVEDFAAFVEQVLGTSDVAPRL